MGGQRLTSAGWHVDKQRIGLPNKGSRDGRPGRRLFRLLAKLRYGWIVLVPFQLPAPLREDRFDHAVAFVDRYATGQLQPREGHPDDPCWSGSRFARQPLPRRQC